MCYVIILFFLLLKKLNNMIVSRGEKKLFLGVYKERKDTFVLNYLIDYFLRI